MYDHYLTIEIVNTMDLLASARYYHAAFSDTAAALVSTIIRESQSIDYTDCQDDIHKAVYLLSMTGAGTQPKERQLIKKDSDISGVATPEFLDESEGAMALSQDGLTENRKMSDGVAIIDIDEKTVRFNVYDKFTPDTYKRRQHKLPNDLPLFKRKYFTSGIPFSDFGEFQKLITGNRHGGRIADGTVIQWRL